MSEDSAGLRVVPTLSGPTLLSGISVDQQFCYPGEQCRSFPPEGVDVP